MWQKWWKGGGRGGVVCSIATDNSVRYTWSVPSCIYYYLSVVQARRKVFVCGYVENAKLRRNHDVSVVQNVRW